MHIRSQVEKYIDTYSTDETQARAMRIAICGTGILWFILLILLAVAPGFNRQKKYKTIKIMLAPVAEKPADKKVASQAGAQKSSAMSSEKSAEKTVTKKQEAPKPLAKASEVQKPAASEPKKAAYKVKKSVEELMQEQSKAPSAKNANWDNLAFKENVSSSPEQSSSVSSGIKSISNEDALSGSAGKVDSSGNSEVESKNTKSSAGTDASMEVSNYLSGIINTAFNSTASEGLASKMANGVSLHSDGKYTMDLADGTSRVLLKPAKPYIYISEKNAKFIDNRRDVKITFKILAQGNVPVSGIEIKPESALPLEVQQEIKEQISKWLFSGASGNGQASFDYSIIKH